MVTWSSLADTCRENRDFNRLMQMLIDDVGIFYFQANLPADNFVFGCNFEFESAPFRKDTLKLAEKYGFALVDVVEIQSIQACANFVNVPKVEMVIPHDKTTDCFV